MKTFCPECGFGVKVDVDGCCLYCGSVATGSAVDELEKTMGDEKMTIEEAGVIAVGMSEHLDAKEQAFFVAGFQEAIKYLIKTPGVEAAG